MASRKTQQWIVVGAVSGIAILALLAANLTMNSASGEFVDNFDSGDFDAAVIRDRTSAASPEMTWITQSSMEVEELSKSVTALERALEEQAANHQAVITELMEGSAEQLLAMQRQLNTLTDAPERSSITGQPVQSNNAGQTSGDPIAAQPAAFTQNGPNLLGGFFNRNGGGQGAAGPVPVPGSGTGVQAGSASAPGGIANGLGLAPSFGQEFTLASLPEGEAVAERKHLGVYLPPGSYAPATIISGVDASTGVTDQSNPIPVLMRITGPAVAAGERSTRGARINLTGCTVTGSARGDLSSERVYVRLDTMTCIHRGFVVERDVAGFVAGSGKAGVRGPVVSREGDLVGKAAVAGALEGLAGAMGSVSEQTAEADGVSMANLLKSAGTASLAGATENAATTLADYYINRAEQYQPVVSVYGGTTVEIVFMEGVDLRIERE